MARPIGQFLVEKGLINQSQIPIILAYAKKNNLRFGEAALAMQLFTRDELIQVLGPNYLIDFFQLDPTYYPQATKDLFPKDVLLKYGVLPLGYKTEYKLFRSKKILNIGLLDPAQKEIATQIENLAQEKLGKNSISSIKVFLILADQYLDILNSVYGMSEEEIRRQDLQKLDPTLSMFLEKQ